MKQIIDDEEFKIKAKKLREKDYNFDEQVGLYKQYVSKAETDEERLCRINKFRCGGR